MYTMFVVTVLDSFPLKPTETAYHDSLAECAAKIATQNFEWRYTTLLLFNSTLVSGLNLFLKLYEQTLIVGKGKFYPSFAQKTRQYIIFGTDVTNIGQMLAWMKTHQFDNSGKYVVACESRECDENQAVDVFWDHKITNIIFLKLVANGEIASYSYFFPNEKCTHSKPVRTEVCSSTSSYDNLFPRKLKNLRRCPIIVSTFLQVPFMNITKGKPKGADGDLLLLIAERLNANLTMMTPLIGDGWGKLEPNSTWSGSLADLLEDAANFSMTSPALTISRFSNFQMSVPYYTVTVVWVTHTAPEKPASLNLFYPFETFSQIVLAFSFIFVAFCAWFVNSKYWPFSGNKTEEKRIQRGILFYSWMICMGLPSTKLPGKPAFMYMALFWIWYCFLIRTFYQVGLISSLQGSFYYKELETVEEAFAKNYSIGGGLALREYFIDYSLVYDNWNTVSTGNIVPTLINLTDSTSKFVLAMNLETAKNVIKKRKLTVHILPHVVINSPTVIFFKKFSPLAESVNIVLWRLVEGGFVEHIRKKYASKRESKNTENSSTPITLEHYTGCYVILITGWIVSTLLFIVELFYNKLQRNRCHCTRRREKLIITGKSRSFMI